MTRSTLLSHSPLAYESTLRVASATHPGVAFTVYRMSFGRRTELTTSIREMSRKGEFLEAGNDFAEQVEANLLACEIEKMYLRWGLVSIEGLTIDGEAASVDLLIDRGPEDLAKEIVTAVRAQCGLSEEERKN